MADDRINPNRFVARQVSASTHHDISFNPYAPKPVGEILFGYKPLIQTIHVNPVLESVNTGYMTKKKKKRLKGHDT